MGKLVENMKALTKWTNPEKVAEYMSGGVGQDNYRWRLVKDPKTGKNIKQWSSGWNCHVEFDCTGLIFKALRILGVATERFSTQTLKTQPYLRPLEPNEAKKDGDILIIEARRQNPETKIWSTVGEHAAVIETWNNDTKSGTFFGMQSSGPGLQPFGPDLGKAWGTWTAYRLTVPLGPTAEEEKEEEEDDNDCTTHDCQNDPRQSFDAAGGVCDPPPRRDPLILDLDGNGIQTTHVNSGPCFDHDGNGFAEQTGWIDPNDGLLVMDRNGDGIINDGKELFGDETILKNGARATNGFQALAELDSNHDGKIDTSDAAYSQLMVWQDADEDGYSSLGEFWTLGELGIKSINLDFTMVNNPDAQGNTQRMLGAFQWIDCCWLVAMWRLGIVQRHDRKYRLYSPCDTRWS